MNNNNLNNNNVCQAYCINCVKQDRYCSECKQLINNSSTTLDQNTIYCVIENGELHEMKIMNKKSPTKNSTVTIT